jgi:hypothetical protein
MYYEMIEEVSFDETLGGNVEDEDDVNNDQDLEETGSQLTLGQRVATGVIVVPSFLVIDIMLYKVTKANTVALVLAPEPISKAVLLVNEILLAGADVVIACVHVSYAHWVVTGYIIDSWDDVTDWTLSP